MSGFGADLARVERCLAGDARARDEVLAEIDRAVVSWARKSRVPAWQHDELVQASRVAMLGAAGDRPRLRQYSGRAPLGGWLKVACGRICLNVLRGAAQAQRVAQGAKAPVAPARSSMSRRDAQRVLKSSLAEALDALDDDARTLLGLQFVHGLDGGRISERLQLHRITVVRRQKQAKVALRSAWLEALRRRLGDDAQAVLDDAFEVELSFSLPRLLAPRAQG